MRLVVRLIGLGLIGTVAILGCASPAGPPKAITVKNFAFTPASLEITKGTTVTWTNHDNFTHSVQFLDGGLPTEPMLMQPGATTTFTFTTPGTYRYQCHLHPQNMQGTVAVTP